MVDRTHGKRQRDVDDSGELRAVRLCWRLCERLYERDGLSTLMPLGTLSAGEQYVSGCWPPRNWGSWLGRPGSQRTREVSGAGLSEAVKGSEEGSERSMKGSVEGSQRGSKRVAKGSAMSRKGSERAVKGQ